MSTGVEEMHRHGGAVLELEKRFAGFLPVLVLVYL